MCQLLLKMMYIGVGSTLVSVFHLNVFFLIKLRCTLDQQQYFSKDRSNYSQQMR